jgi:predicted TIM-barrel fold metal-dependent hydrolase
MLFLPFINECERRGAPFARPLQPLLRFSVLSATMRENAMPSKLIPRTPDNQAARSAVVASHHGDNAQWRALRREEILEPALPIVDAHHHLWQRGSSRYLVDEYLAEAQAGHDIRASVYVECGSFYRRRTSALMAPLGEVEFANGMAAMAASDGFGSTLIGAGIVGTADLTVGAQAARVLDAHMAVAPDRFRGIRLISKWDADEELNNGRYVIPRDLMRDRDFRVGFALLAPRKLSFDAMVYHPQLPEVSDLARAFPDTTIVLNHVGGPLAGARAYLARKDEADANWRSGMVALARCPNVHVKLGGLGMPYLGFGFDKLQAPASSEQLAQAWGPYIEHCIEAFGPQRCMFESNFPPDRASADFHVIWNAFKRIAAKYPADEKRALFHDTAAKAYRLNLEA